MAGTLIEDRLKARFWAEIESVTGCPAFPAGDVVGTDGTGVCVGVGARVGADDGVAGGLAGGTSVAVASGAGVGVSAKAVGRPASVAGAGGVPTADTEGLGRGAWSVAVAVAAGVGPGLEDRPPQAATSATTMSTLESSFKGVDTIQGAEGRVGTSSPLAPAIRLPAASRGRRATGLRRPGSRPAARTRPRRRIQRARRRRCLEA